MSPEGPQRACERRGRVSGLTGGRSDRDPRAGSVASTLAASVRRDRLTSKPCLAMLVAQTRALGRSCACRKTRTRRCSPDASDSGSAARSPNRLKRSAGTTTAVRGMRGDAGAASGST